MNDLYLLRFLHARKMKVDESFKLLTIHHEYKKRNPSLYENMTLQDPLIQQALYDGFPGVLANRDRYSMYIFLLCNMHSIQKL